MPALKYTSAFPGDLTESSIHGQSKTKYTWPVKVPRSQYST